MICYLLSEEELKLIHQEASKHRCPPDERLRLLCIYWAGKGKTVHSIHEMLLIPQRTIYTYLQEYASQKKTKNDDTPSSGRPTKLSPQQEQDLKAHLIEKTYASTLAVIEYIHHTYAVHFSQGGLAQRMHRHGFRYKRPKRVPYTVNVAQQEEFVTFYNNLKKQAKDDEMILFIDGVHPDHQTQHVHGWIQRSQLAQVPSTAQQKRLHYMGAISIQNDTVHHQFKEYKTIDSDSIQDFLESLMHRYPAKKLNISCDRGPYHTSKATKNFVQKHKNLNLIYLPPRCPNLNLIERLWKIMREHVTYNRYYKHFSEFQNAIRTFFNEQITTLQPSLLRRLRENFHIIHPVFLQTIS